MARNPDPAKNPAPDTGTGLAAVTVSLPNTSYWWLDWLAGWQAGCWLAGWSACLLVAGRHLLDLDLVLHVDLVGFSVYVR